MIANRATSTNETPPCVLTLYSCRCVFQFHDSPTRPLCYDSYLRPVLPSTMLFGGQLWVRTGIYTCSMFAVLLPIFMSDIHAWVLRALSTVVAWYSAHHAAPFQLYWIASSFEFWIRIPKSTFEKNLIGALCFDFPTFQYQGCNIILFVILFHCFFLRTTRMVLLCD